MLTSWAKERRNVLNAREKLSHHPHQQSECLVISESGGCPQIEREGQKSEAIGCLNWPTGGDIS